MKLPEDNPPPKPSLLPGCLLIVLVLLLIGISVCGNMNFGTR